MAAPKKARNLAEHWRKAGPELARVRRWELRNLDYQEHWTAIDSLLQVAQVHARPRLTSGLVEFQRLLARSRR